MQMDEALFGLSLLMSLTFPFGAVAQSFLRGFLGSLHTKRTSRDGEPIAKGQAAIIVGPHWPANHRLALVGSRSMLKQGYTMGQVQHPDDEVYQRLGTECWFVGLLDSEQQQKTRPNLTQHVLCKVRALYPK